MPIRRTWSRRLVSAFAALGLLGGAYLTGFVSADRNLPPASALRQLDDRLAALRKRDAAVGKQEINTALIRVAVTEVPVPATLDLRGGGITMAGNSLLGITGAGELFRLRGEVATKLDIQPPANHLAEYKAAASSDPKLSALNHDFSLFRYNLLQYVLTSGRHLLFLTYTEWQPQQQCYALAIARLELPPSFETDELHAGPEDWSVIHRTRPCLPVLTTHDAIEAHMGGGAMAFDHASGQLLVATGDYRLDGVYAPQTLSQDNATDYGKLLSMSPDGGQVRHLATGLRNPEGLLLLADGEIWETEHGPRGGDELNRIVPGGNYGWPLRTLGTRYSSLPWPLSPTNGRHDEGDAYVSPVFGWVPSAGVSGIARVEGFDPAWDGDFLVASLRAQTLFRLRVTGGRVQYSEPIVLPHRIRQVLQLPGRQIALWTDSRKVLYLRPAAASRTLLRARQDIATIAAGDAVRSGRLENALQRCMECHSLDPEASANSPHLSGIGGRSVASTSYPNYSAALRTAGGKWTHDRLAAYLADPQGFAPGTTMPAPQLEESSLRDLVRLLDGLGSPE